MHIAKMRLEALEATAITSKNAGDVLKLEPPVHNTCNVTKLTLCVSSSFTPAELQMIFGE